MFKKAMAVMLAAVMLLQPVMASAVTWGAVVGTINTLRKNGITLETEVEENGEGTGTKVTVTGDVVKIENGKITGVHIDDGSASDYTFIDVAIDGEEFRIYLDSETAKVSLEGNTELNVDGVYVDANSNTASGTLTVKDGVTINANRVEMFAQQGGQAVLDNSGTVSGDNRVEIRAVNGNASVTNQSGATLRGEEVVVYVTENGEAEFTNEGKIDSEWMSIVAYDGGKATGKNTSEGTIIANQQIAIGADSIDEETGEYGNQATASFINSGEISGSGWEDEEGYHENELHAFARGDSEVTVTNTVDGEINARVPIHGGNDNWEDDREQEAPEDAEYSMTFNNEGAVNGNVQVFTWENGTATTTNGGKVNGQILGEGYESASVTVDNTSKGTIDSVWVSSFGESNASVTNDGKVNGELGGGVYSSEGTTTITNENYAGSSWISAYEGGSVTMQNNATIEGSIGISTDGATDLNIAQGEKATGGEISEIYIETGSNEVLSDEKIAKITENLNLGSESVIHTVNEEGQITAIYEVNEDGEVELVESFVKVEPVVDNGPSPEMIRHWMEELRQQQAIGGVYGSPYWLKQLYLGYHSLELRLYENGERELFREMLSWYNGGPEKRLTLRVNVENPQDLTMRLDGEVIDILERCEFAVITLQDKNKNVVMEYNVADLKAARALYGLARTDLLCVGGPDSEVMKIGADGQMVSVEQDAAK